ncbi:putative ABC transporter permease subunit [Brevibacillus panacihumi]|uniref:putative ABC transporter permease subunit n=1 Tax=Brevibacillus panacihumi TaxID=497735 RepID=UPI003D1E2FFC
MNNIWLLTKIMLKNSSRMGARKKGSEWKSLMLVALMLIGFLPMIISGVWFVAEMYDGLAQIGQESAILGMGLAMVSCAIFVLGIVYVITVFYYSQDVEHLLPLPLAPREILGAKFLVALFYEYLTELVLIGPLLVVYGVKSDAGVLYYLFAIVLFLVVPVVPLALSSILVMLFMRFTNIGKRKDRLRLIGGIVGIGAVLGFQYFIQRQNSAMEDIEQMQQQLLSGENVLLNLATQIFPSTKLAVLALVESGYWSGLGYLFAFLLATLAGILLFSFAGDRLYFAGVMGISDSAGTRRKVEGHAFAKLAQMRPAWWSYTIKEWRVIWRTPAYMLNCLLPSLLMPFLILIPLVGIQDRKDLLEAFRGWITGTGGISVAIFLAGSIVLAGMNSASVTAITREGQAFFLSKSFPLPFRQFLLAKLFPGTILSILSIFVLLAIAVWFLPITPLLAGLAVLVSIPGVMLMNQFGFLIDLQRPKLSWTSEQEAVKQNINPLFSLLFGGVLAAITILGVVSWGGSLIPVALVLFLVFGILNLMLYQVLVKKGPEWMDKIEE